jgi:hypothetical protein
VIYRFEIVRADASLDTFERDLPDDFAAIEWMGAEALGRGDILKAFRGNGSHPFARREFAGNVEVIE